jgi:anti-sigma regulatory factor (Ser/Thr protein kinase)
VVEAAIVKRLEVQPKFEQVGTARRFVRRELSAASPDLAGDMQLIVSELVSNAIEHGASEQVTVEISVSNAKVVLSVESHGFVDQLPRLEQWALAPSDEVSGRGLGIVRDLADAVQVVRENSSITITVHRRFIPATATAS